jgi:hypothetical protein
MTFKRKYFDDEVIVLFNKDSLQQIITVADESEDWKVHFGHKLHVEGDKIEVHVPAYGFEILTRLKGQKSNPWKSLFELSLMFFSTKNQGKS